MKMKVQVRSLILLTVAVLQVRSQNQTETRYEDIISVALPQLLPGEEQAFRPIVNQLQVETLNTEDVDQSEVSVRLTFPMQETFCSKSQGQPGKPCPLKKNGQKIRTRRSKVRICSRGRNCRSSPGGGSVIGRPVGGSPPGGGSKFIDEFIRDHSDGNRFA